MWAAQHCSRLFSSTLNRLCVFYCVLFRQWHHKLLMSQFRFSTLNNIGSKTLFNTVSTALNRLCVFCPVYMYVLCKMMSVQLLYVRQPLSQYKTIVLAVLINTFFRKLCGQNFRPFSIWPEKLDFGWKTADRRGNFLGSGSATF